MYRYLIEIKYNGSKYFGCQVQPNKQTVQGEINKKISIILSNPINVIGCGRTDTGVHAQQFFCHFDFDEKINLKDLKFKLNNFLSSSISIINIISVNPDFHSRFTAISRTYEYWITNEKNPFLSERSLYLIKPLDLGLFNYGASLLVGRKDFSSFCKTKSDVKNKICTVSESICYQAQDMYVFKIKSNRFLHNMVRSIVGTLIEFSNKKITKNDLINIIDKKDRTKSGFSVPPWGLYLKNVEYPKIDLNEKDI